MGLTLKAALERANMLGTLAGLQEALGLTDDQILIRLDCAAHEWHTAKNYDRNRKDWLRALRWLLVEKWLHDEEVAASKIGLSEGETIFYNDTPEGGMIVLAHWPEGFVLRYKGKIAWKSWADNPTEPAEPTDQDLVNAMHRHMMAIRELRAQLYARDIKIEFSAQSEAANNPWVYARFTKQMAPKDS